MVAFLHGRDKRHAVWLLCPVCAPFAPFEKAIVFLLLLDFSSLRAFLLHSASIGMESVSASISILQGSNILMLASWVLALVSLFVSVASRPEPYAVSSHRVGNGIASSSCFPR